MFRIFKKTTKPACVPAQEFKFAMDFAKDTLAIEKSNQDRIVILNFMLNVIKKDLQTDLLSHIFYSEEHFAKQFRYPFPLFYYDEQGNEQGLPEEGIIEIDLAQDAVLVLPWHRERLRGQIKNIFSNNFVYDRSNHMAYCFPYIDLCYVYNGIHSVSSGIFHKKGIIKAKAYDITKLFFQIHTDGRNWYNSHNNEKRGELADFRLGIIYEIAKMKYAIENNTA